MRPDPIVEEVRRVRDEHAQRHGYDLDRIYEDLKDQERKSGRSFICLPARPVRQPSTPAAKENLA